MPNLQIKRAYDDILSTDGFRILIDRLWPRGIPRRTYPLDDWARSIAPSPESRKAFGHDPEKMDAFRSRYREELAANPAAPVFVELVAARLCTGNVTLLYGARNEKANHAVILRDWLEEQLAGRVNEAFCRTLPGSNREWPS